MKTGLTNQRTGKTGEKIAGKFLVSRGFSILESNFRTPFGEIDFVAKQDGYLVFVEVKTRTSERFGSPFSAITEVKRKHIINNCLYYLKRHGQCDAPCRIDVIGIKLDSLGRVEVL
ncbi:MAG: YraN family protein, partial [Candidatus Omnitrophota bacterium]